MTFLKIENSKTFPSFLEMFCFFLSSARTVERIVDGRDSTWRSQKSWCSQEKERRKRRLEDTWQREVRCWWLPGSLWLVLSSYRYHERQPAFVDQSRPGSMSILWLGSHGWLSWPVLMNYNSLSQRLSVYLQPFGWSILTISRLDICIIFVFETNQGTKFFKLFLEELTNDLQKTCHSVSGSICCLF